MIPYLRELAAFAQTTPTAVAVSGFYATLLFAWCWRRLGL